MLQRIFIHDELLKSKSNMGWKVSDSNPIANQQNSLASASNSGDGGRGGGGGAMGGAKAEKSIRLFFIIGSS